MGVVDALVWAEEEATQAGRSVQEEMFSLFQFVDMVGPLIVSTVHRETVLAVFLRVREYALKLYYPETRQVEFKGKKYQTSSYADNAALMAYDVSWAILGERMDLDQVTEGLRVLSTFLITCLPVIDISGIFEPFRVLTMESGSTSRQPSTDSAVWLMCGILFETVRALSFRLKLDTDPDLRTDERARPPDLQVEPMTHKEIQTMSSRLYDLFGLTCAPPGVASSRHFYHVSCFTAGPREYEKCFWNVTVSPELFIKFRSGSGLLGPGGLWGPSIGKHPFHAMFLPICTYVSRTIDSTPEWSPECFEILSPARSVYATFDPAHPAPFLILTGSGSYIRATEGLVYYKDPYVAVKDFAGLLRGQPLPIFQERATEMQVE